MDIDVWDENGLLQAAAERSEVLSRERIVLYAGANLPSEAAQKAYAAGLSAYPAMGPSFDKEQPETDLVSRLEVAVRSEICTLFSAKWAEPRLPSCTIANMAVFHAFTRPGDLLLAPSADHGGHLSQRRGGTPDLAGLEVKDLPFDMERCRLDSDAAAALIRKASPAMVMLGRSVMIKPDELQGVVEAARHVGAKTVFDASHVSGLIAGGTFPNPLALGVDVMTSSTYKTIAGRPHSIIAGNRAEDGARLADLIDRKLLANYDAGRLPSFLVTLRETRGGAKAYAAKVCHSSEVLAGALRQRSVEVLAPSEGEQFTHQILVPLAAHLDPSQVMKELEKVGILVGTCKNPLKRGHHALRVGTQFITAQGCEDAYLGMVAEKVALVLNSLPLS
jgi:glycine hydroxymethyltransferase